MVRLHDLLRAAAERRSEQPVFVGKRGTCTYGELERASGRVAAALRALGVARGDCVALAIDGDADFLVAYYAIVKAGAAVVPLCSDARASSLVHALAHAGAAAVILDAQHAGLLAGRAAELPALRLVVHRGARADCAPFATVAFDELRAFNAELHDAGTSADDLLSITYTSGTTARPKGVMLAHRNLVANVRSIVEYLALTATDRVAMVLPFYYVYGNSVLHTHVSVGGTIVHAGSMAFPAQVLDVIEREQCTGFAGVPATFARLLEADGLQRRDVGSVRYLTQAGAAMTPQLTARVREAFPHAQLFVMYGQTEAGARLAYVPPEELERKSGSVGKAIPGVELSIVDADGRAVECGVVGEVVARGDNVMLGYWNDPAETARALRGGALHTGDLGSLDEDGFLFLVGRTSEMIKSGAHRIAPREIEAVIEALPGVRECAVAGLPDERMGQVIAAFVVAEPGAQLDRNALLAACLAELPRFKLPEHVFLLDDLLPRTPTGKVRRFELVERYAERSREPAPVV
jgi:acyl-CoA synthetase (AMP-forming)/AMP-acid ligase II